MEIIQQNDNQLADLSDDRITAEILIYKDQVGYGMIELGKRLIEMKRRLGHGKFLDYLANEVEFSDQTARNFMKIAEECSNSKTFLNMNLSLSKVYAILGVPTEDRETFLNTPHQVETKNGTVEKTVDEMTVREVKQVIELKKQLAEKEANERSQAHKITSLNFALEKKELEIQNLIVDKDKEVQTAKSATTTIVQEIIVESPELKKALMERENELRLLKTKINSTDLEQDRISKLQEETKDLRRQLNLTRKFYDEELSVTTNQRHEIEALQEQIKRNNCDDSDLTNYFKINLKNYIENQIILLDTLNANSGEINNLKNNIIKIIEEY